MTQFFMGVKPGVGPVLKILKYDTDDPLTLANNRYDRYFFNSENEKLSYIFGTASIQCTFSYWPFGEANTNLYGNSSTSQYSVISQKNNSGAEPRLSLYALGRVKNIAPNFPYIPMPEVRFKNLSTGRVMAGQRRVYNSMYIISHYQFAYNIINVSYKFSRFGNDPSPWLRGISDRFTNVMVGDWVYKIGETAAPRWGNGVGSTSVSSNGNGEGVLLINNWALPANNAPMPTYQYSANKEALRLDSDGLVLTRPGYSVDGSSGIEQRIIGGSISPALCVMFGTAENIPSWGSRFIPAPNGVVLSDTATVDFMYQEVGEELFIPGYVNHPFDNDTQFNLSYSVSAAGLSIFNEGSSPMTVRYAVFNTDESPISTGGSDVLFKGNDGAGDFIQIKQPGTSDPASRPNDILVDTRFPSLQIISEGFIPLSSFSADSAESQAQLGKVAYNLPFNANGMTTYLKYTVVFNGYILPPINTRRFTFLGPVTTVREASNQSCLARLRANEVKFWLNPGNWSHTEYSNSSGDYVLKYDGPDPLGIRYYLFGVAS